MAYVPLDTLFGALTAAEFVEKEAGTQNDQQRANIRSLKSGAATAHVEYELDAATKESVCDLLDHLAKWGVLHFSNSERSTE